jgi:hypothetical protein
MKMKRGAPEKNNGIKGSLYCLLELQKNRAVTSTALERRKNI